MLQTTAREIAAVTGGELVGGATGDELVTGTARIDSREVGPGDLFAAFLGEHVDGHDFLDAARTAGAALSLVTDAAAAAEHSLPAVRVDDVRDALAALARAQLARPVRRTPSWWSSPSPAAPARPAPRTSSARSCAAPGPQSPPSAASTTSWAFR